MNPNFSYLTLFASACFTACLLLALAHLSLWFRGKNRREHMLCSIMTFGAGFVTLFEFALVMADDIPTAEIWLRQLHLALFITVLSLVAFIRIYLNAGSRWLIVTIGLMWSCTLIADIVSTGSFIRTQITDLYRLETVWGESYSIAVGLVTPWKYLTDVASVLVFVFLAQATLTARRNGLRGRAVIVGGSSIAFILIAGILVPLQDAGIVTVPLITSAAFLTIVVALASQLINDAFNANESMLEVEQLRRAMTLGEMVGGLAHEINQPLSAILCNAQAAARFLKADDVDLDEIREIVDDIIADEKRASGFIRGLRQMLERNEVETFSADVNAVAQSAAGFMSGELHTREVNLQLDLQPSLRPARVDALQLQQVLINLLLNAVRAAATMPRQRRSISIRTSGIARGVEVSVWDRGRGIDEAKKATLFQPFVSTSKDGLGMGLAVCRRIVERYGGTIWAEDRKGGGAVVRFTLPFAEERS
jgi:signal transduction histidine kinase